MSLSHLDSNSIFENCYYTVNYNEHSNLLLKNLNNLRTNSLSFTDVNLCAENVDFPCHRSVLAASSEYFLAMFTSNLTESKEGRIYFNDFSADTISTILEYIYTGSLKVSTKNIQDLFTAANLMHYPLIIEACCNFFIKNLDANNCLGIEEFARLHGQADLQLAAHNFTILNFNQVILSEEFLQLSIERLIGYISNSLIFVPSEEVVVSSLCDWVEFHLEHRKQHLIELLKYVRLSAIKSSILEKFRLRPAFDSYNEHLTNIQPSCKEVRPSTLPREVLASFCLREQEELHLDIFDSLRDSWTKLGPCPVPASDFSATIIHNNILITGGNRGVHTTREAWWFDSASLKWSRLSDICEARAQHTSMAVGWRAFIFGGTSSPFVKNAAAIRTIECMDLECMENVDKERFHSMPQWSVICKATFPRISSCIASHGNVLHEVGGTQYGVAVKKMNNYHLTYLLEKHGNNVRMEADSLCPLNRIEINMRLNEESEPGEQLVLPETIEHAAIVSLSNIFYIASLDTKKFISLDPQRRIFRNLGSSLSSHLVGSMVVFEGVIYLLGGLGELSAEYYDVKKNVWVRTDRFGLLDSSVAVLNLSMKC